MSDLVPGKSALERAKLIASQLYRSTPDLFHNHKSTILSSNLNPTKFESPRPTSSTEEDLVRCIEFAKDFIRAKQNLIKLNEQLETLKSHNIQQELEFERQIEDLNKRI